MARSATTGGRTLVGISRADAYHAAAVRRETDEVNPRNNTKFWTACWNVTHAELGDPLVALKAWERSAT